MPIPAARPAKAGAGGQRAADTSGVPPAVSRLLLGAQEDLRREIARAMHDGPAQSLTNIVLQAQIVERLVETDPAKAGNEVRQLVAMVQQTLEATKSFIFDVRPMVLDDLGLVPTLRRAARERGRRAGVPVEFDSLGPEQRLPMDLESGLFRILDEAMAAYLSARAERVSIRLDWAEQLEARVAASRAAAEPRPDQTPEADRGQGPAAGPGRDDGGPPRGRARRASRRRGARRSSCCRRPRGARSRAGRRPSASLAELSADGAELRLVGGPAGRDRPGDRRRVVSPRTASAMTRRERGQGLVEYGLILALTSTVHGADPRRLRRDAGGRPGRHRHRDRRRDRRLTGRPVRVDPPYHQPSSRCREASLY